MSRLLKVNQFMTVIASVVVGVHATAADPVPWIDIEGTAEVQGDWAFAADQSSLRANDLTLSVEPTMAIRLTPRLLLVLEPVLESLSEGAASASNDRNFGDLGLSVETLFLTYNADERGLFVGKFNPLFGRAWDLAAGLYGSDFAEDYEITERLGIGGYFDLSPSLGVNRLSASMFLADTTLLSETAFNNRGRFTRRLGGPSNTGELSSFAATIEGPLAARGSTVGSLALNYHAGLAYHRGSERDPEDEIELVLASYGSLSITSDTSLDILIELVHQSGALARNRDRRYLTTSAALIRVPWTLSAVYTRRSNKPHTKSVLGPASNDHLAQLSLAYGFGRGVAIEAGYRYSQVGNTDQHTLGVLLSYEFDFSVR